MIQIVSIHINHQELKWSLHFVEMAVTLSFSQFTLLPEIEKWAINYLEFKVTLF
jgi:hypothetical protein